MAITTERTYQGNELKLELAVLKLCRALTELAAAVDRLAVKEHYKCQDEDRSKEEFSAIQQALANAKKELEAIADRFEAAS